jgi:uncharacterized protein YndB with AHSA1/START domain
LIVGANLTVRLSATVSGSRLRVFTAMTDPAQVAQWWGPKGFTCPEVNLDVRVGGVYRIAMCPPVGGMFHLVGAYVEVVPPSRLAYTFRWEPPDPDDRETIARLTLRDSNGGTDVELLQGTFATEARRDLHQAGWADSLDRLASHLATT